MRTEVAEDGARPTTQALTVKFGLTDGRPARPSRREEAGHCAQVALGWLLARKPWIVPIPGTTRLERLDENLGAAQLTLTSDDLRAIDDGAAQIQLQGEGYPEHLEKRTGL